MNKEVFDKYSVLAQLAANVAAEKKGLTNIDWRWLMCQWTHETQYFTNWGATVGNNFGGLKQFKPQPEWFDGDATSSEGDPYQVFESPEAYADYFGRYLGYYVENGIDQVTTLEEYVTALKEGGYFGDKLETYVNRCNEIYAECFEE